MIYSVKHSVSVQKLINLLILSTSSSTLLSSGRRIQEGGKSMKLTVMFLLLLLATILQHAFSVCNYDNEHIHAWWDNYHGESRVSFREEEEKKHKKPLCLCSWREWACHKICITDTITDGWILIDVAWRNI